MTSGDWTTVAIVVALVFAFIRTARRGTDNQILVDAGEEINEQGNNTNLTVDRTWMLRTLIGCAILFFGGSNFIVGPLLDPFMWTMVVFMVGSVIGVLYIDYKNYVWRKQREIALVQERNKPPEPPAAPVPPPEPEKPALPEELRTSHAMVCAGSGAGKTQLLQSLIWDDVQKGYPLIVIDSQSQMINKLSERIPRDRQILIDPEYCPPQLNIFSQPPTDMSTAVELMEYIFSALDTQLTTKQATAYRYLSRLLFTIPGASIHTMRELLEMGGEKKYQQYIDQLDETARSFFEQYSVKSQFGETRQQILTRLYTVLENQTFAAMLGAPSFTIDIGPAIRQGKVVLVNTNKTFLKHTGAALFGRIFIAQIMQTIMGRSEGRRVLVYIDEFADYAEESHILFNLFEQARKYGLGMTVAFQYIGQLPPKLQQSLASNTAIKFAAGLSSEDRTKMASQMGVDSEYLARLQRGVFLVSLRNQGVRQWPVEFGRLEAIPVINDISDTREKMRQRFGIPYPTDNTPILRAVAEEAAPYQGREVPEKGDW